MLGYFSLIGLLRVHVLLGDFTLALKVMENIELNQKVCNRLWHIIQRLNQTIGFLHASNRLSRSYILLCWLFVHGNAPVQRCHPDIRVHSQLHW